MAGETPAQSRIFISYRREDAAGHVLALIPPLRQRFGPDRIFKDTDNIAPGQDFLNVIQRELETCAVLLAVIGRDWLTVQDPRLKCRRVDTPNDFLRLEVATALKNEHILVIPTLVGRATMPAAEDLPPDLQPLARRNAVELSDQRWDSDVERLVQAIERACAQPISPRPPQPEKDAESKSGTAWERQLLEARRKRQIAQHVAAASRALDSGDPQSALQSCEKAAWLDPDEPESRELASRARKVLEQRKIDGWLDDARQKLDQGDLGGASELIDQALLLNSSYRPAVTLRERLLRERRSRGRERERARLVQAAVDRARARLNGRDFDGAIQSADDALAIAADCTEAIAVRARAVAASEDARRAKGDTGRAQAAVMEAREMFAAGEHEAALNRLDEFGPRHALVISAREELQKKFDDARRREQQAAAKTAAEAAARRERQAREEDRREQQAAAKAAAEAAARRERQAREEEDRRARQTVDESWRAFAVGDHEGALAALESFRQSHQLVSQALHQMRAKLDALERARQEQEQREQDEQRALPWSHVTTVTGPSRFTFRLWQSAAALIATLGLGTWFVLMRPGPPSTPMSNPRQVGAGATPASDAQAKIAGKNEPSPAQTPQSAPPTPVRDPVDLDRAVARIQVPTAAVATAPQVAGGALLNADAPTQPAVTPGSNEPAASAQLGNLKTRARSHQQAGQRELAQNTVVQGLEIDPKDPTLLSIQSALLRDAEASAARSKRTATGLDAEDWAPEPFQQALEQERNAAKLRRSGALDAATRSFWAAAEQFGAASRESRLAQNDANTQALAASVPAAKAPLAQATASAPVDHAANQAADQVGVERALRRYEIAYASLDVDNVRSVYPSVPASPLQGDFASYRSYTLKIEIEDLSFLRAPTVTLATVRCHVTEDIQPKSGRRVQNDRSQIFKLQKQGQSWIIVQIS